MLVTPSNGPSLVETLRTWTHNAVSISLPPCTTCGALTCVLGLFALVLLGMGVFLNSDLLAAEAQQPPPEWLGSFFGIIGVAVFVLVEGIGLLNILSGRWIKHRRNRTGSIVVAAIDCLNMPWALPSGSSPS